MSIIAGSTTDAIRCENRLIKFLLQLLVLAMLQFVYVVYVAVYAFLLRRARAVVGEIPCQICRSEISGIDVTSTTRESLKESKDQLASPEVFTISKVSNCLREASHIWVEVDRAASWPSCHYLKKCHFFFYLLTALGTWFPKPSDHHACLDSQADAEAEAAPTEAAPEARFVMLLLGGWWGRKFGFLSNSDIMWYRT